MEELYKRYLETFGTHPPLLFGDAPEDVEEAMRMALLAGKPWTRKANEQERVA